jgi:hypothetical protein
MARSVAKRAGLTDVSGFPTALSVMAGLVTMGVELRRREKISALSVIASDLLISLSVSLIFQRLLSLAAVGTPGMTASSSY